MQNIDIALDKAEYLLQLARQRPTKLKGSSTSSSSKWKSIHQKLTDIFIEESCKESTFKPLYNSSHLLERLIAKEKLNCLIVNLYPGNEGYSVMLKNRSGTEIETVRLPYEEYELLQCINNEELPPILVDLLDRSQVNIFYNGCVIVEIRDYRRSSNPATYDCHHVLLKPTTQTLLCDVNLIASDNNKWTPEDKQQLENQLLLATQEPLCLNPSVSVALLANRLQYDKNKFNTVMMNRTVKKYSQASVNRKRKFECFPSPRELKLYDYLSKRKDLNRSQTLVSLKLGKNFVEPWKEYPSSLSCPESIEVEKFAKLLERPKTPEDNFPELVEEYILKSEQSQGKTAHTHLTIKKYPIEESYLCELYIDKDYVEGQEKGTSYRFHFRSRDLVDKYIHQFTEIVTEEGRKSVKITHLIPGQPPMIKNTHGPQESSTLMLTIMPHIPTSSPGPSPKQTVMSRTAVSISSLTSTNSQAQTSMSSTIASSQHHVVSGRNPSCQISVTHNPSVPSTSASPGPPNVTSPGSLPSYSQAVSHASSKSNPTPPPPSTRTPTPNSTPALAPTPPPQNTPPSSRRPSSTDNFGVSAAPAAATNVGPLGLISSVPLGLASILTSSGDHTATIASSMSLAGMSMPSGIAVPISLAMMHNTQGNIMSTSTPSGVIVSSIPGLLNTTGLTSTTSQAANAGSLVTNVTSSSSSIATPAVIVTSGMLTSPPPVLATPTSVIPLSIGMTGNLNQLMASNLKGNSANIRAAATAGSPLSLLQVSAAQPALSLFGQLHRPSQQNQVKISSSQNGNNPQHSITPSPPLQSGPTPPSTTASVSTPLLTTILPQQQTILAYQKQSCPPTQTSSQPPKNKSRKRSAPSTTRDQNRSRDSNKK